ncbi:hypothetical protein N9A25_00410 [bacterium]|nr:hypothetical protein [bacterium]
MSTVLPQPKDPGMTDEQLQEFLDKGGVIQKFEYGQRTENISYTNSFYGKKAKRQDDKEEEDDE